MIAGFTRSYIWRKLLIGRKVITSKQCTSVRYEWLNSFCFMFLEHIPGQVLFGDHLVIGIKGTEIQQIQGI